MRNKARPGKRRVNNSSHPAEMKQHALHEDLKDYEEYKLTLLPAIRKDLASGMTAKQIREKYVAYLQAKVITNAILTDDHAQAAATAKDVLDRVEGKATEKKEVSHRFADMKESEIDAILKSEEEDLEEVQGRFNQ